MVLQKTNKQKNMVIVVVTTMNHGFAFCYSNYRLVKPWHL